MARINKDLIDIYFDYGVDRQNRRIFLFDDINKDSVGTIIKGLYYMDSESKERPIELFVGSPGGSEYEMFGLYDVIQTIEAPVHTIAIGHCMSAAPLLVACGEPGFRYAMPNAWFMVHESWDDWGEKRLGEIKKELEHYRAMDSRWCELMEKHSNQTNKFWSKQSNKIGDAFFNAEQAKQWGLVDHIWGEEDV
jgi:ATP-dependent Clp protease, protease subunit